MKDHQIFKCIGVYVPFNLIPRIHKRACHPELDSGSSTALSFVDAQVCDQRFLLREIPPVAAG